MKIKNKMMKIIIISTIMLLLAIGVANANDCTETDNGVDYYEKGSTIGRDSYGGNINQVATYIDRCDDNNQVMEFYCNYINDPNGGQGYISMNNFPCEYGCEDGACKSAPAIPLCTDPDDGINIYEKATTTGARWDKDYTLTSRTDYCVARSGSASELSSCSGDNCGVYEFSCTSVNGGNQFVNGNIYACDNGCSNGECLEEPTCTDSDGGIDYYNKGFVTEGSTGKIMDDYCINPALNQGKLGEWFCNGDRLSIKEYLCPYGCNNGACLQGAADLSIEEVIITQNDNYDSQGRQEVVMKAIIKNIGNSKSGTFDVQMYIDGKFSSSGNGYHGLNPGETVGPFNVGGGTFFEPGNHKVEFKIVPHGEDSNPNNHYSVTFFGVVETLPDLIITKIDIDPNPSIGDTIQEMDVVVKNIGRGVYNGRLDVDFVIDRNGDVFFEEGSGATIYLSKDQSTVITIESNNFDTMPKFVEGSYELTVVLDSTVQESNDFNNKYEEEFDLTSTTKTCTDTDGGWDYYTKGTVSVCTYSSSTTTVGGASGGGGSAGCGGASDYCSGSYVYEKFCVNDKMETKVYMCSNGCNDGACIKTPSNLDMLAEPFVGPDDAPVKIVGYMNYFEKYSPQAFDVIDRLGREYPNKIRFEYSNFPLWEPHNLGANAAECAYALGGVDIFFEMTEEVFEELDMSVPINTEMHQEQLKIELKKIAVKSGLDGAKFEACLNSRQYDAEVNNDKLTGQAFTVQGVPTFIINGKKTSWGYSTVKPIVEGIIGSDTCGDRICMGQEFTSCEADCGNSDYPLQIYGAYYQLPTGPGTDYIRMKVKNRAGYNVDLDDYTLAYYPSNGMSALYNFRIQPLSNNDFGIIRPGEVKEIYIKGGINAPLLSKDRHCGNNIKFGIAKNNDNLKVENFISIATVDKLDCSETVVDKCIDSTGGQNQYVKGTVTLGSETKTDYCQPNPNGVSREVVDWYCRSNTEMDATWVTCPNGCVDGACVKDPSPVIFDSGRGSGPKDKMTYLHYYSEIMFTPSANMVVDGIDPDDYYCNGECYYEAKIYDEDNKLLAQAYSKTMFSGKLDSLLNKAVRFKQDESYRIYQHAWTTKSVGVYTAGVDNPKYADNGKYKINYARSNSADHKDRGPISFKLRGSVESTNACTDSDDGVDYYKKGQTKQNGVPKPSSSNGYDQCMGVRYNSPYPTDECNNPGAGCQLKETYCLNNEATSISYTCPNGCKDGACIREENDYSFRIWTDEKFYEEDDTVTIKARIEADSVNNPTINTWVEDPETHNLQRLSMRQMTCAVSACQPGVYCPSLETCTYEGYYKVGSSHTITTLSSTQEDILDEATEEISSGDTQVASATSQPMPMIELDRYNVLAIATMNGISKGARTGFYVRDNTVRDVDVDFDLENSYNLREKVVLKVDNVGNTPVNYWGGCSTPYHIEMWANNQWNTLIIDNPCMARCLGMSQETLNPGESKVLGTWNQKIYSGDCREPGTQDTAEHIPEYTMADRGTYRAVFTYTDDNGNTEREVNKFNIIGEDECSWECLHTGTRSEGWYDSCTGDLIKYEQCETIEPPVIECDGCLKDDSCVNYGTRLIVDNRPQYCSLSKDFVPQMPEGRVCQNNYECSSNTCLSGKCTDLSGDITDIRQMITQIFNWLTRIFG